MDGDDREVLRIVTLITGMTGSIGSLLAHRLGDVVGIARTEAENVFVADLTKPDLGLSPEDYSYLTKNVTRIVHAAASTRFDLPIDEIREVNVEGTKRVLDLAAACHELEAFVHLSTVYVSGTMIGSVPEGLVQPRGFVNTYERSKWESEQVVASRWDTIPASIVRLSTVIGHVDGRVDHLTAPHHALRIMYLGLASMLPGTPDYRVDLISAEMASEAIVRHLADHHPRTITNVVAGERSYRLAELIDHSFTLLARADPSWGRRGVPKPIIVDRETFDSFVDSVRAADNPIILGVLRAVEHFAHQLTYPKTFETSCSVEPDPIDDCYGLIVQYLVDRRWRL